MQKEEDAFLMLLGMGFKEEQIYEALEICNFDYEQAASYLLEDGSEVQLNHMLPICVAVISLCCFMYGAWEWYA